MEDGQEHLASVRSAFEGSSFVGYKVRFITEQQILDGELNSVQVFVLPQTPALPEAVFNKVDSYVENGGIAVRVGTPIPYDEHGRSRQGVIRGSGNTVLVRGKNDPTEYLHAIDTAVSVHAMPRIPRIVNSNGYPIEGLRTRAVHWEQNQYLYVVNLRKTAIAGDIIGPVKTGRDLLSGKKVEFPLEVPSLEPMLIRLDEVNGPAPVVAVPAEKARS